MLEPISIASDTWLVPNLAPAGPDSSVPMNSLVIRGAEPVIVDTGTPVHRRDWLEQVFGLVEPEDVRWIFISHDDGDHIGNLHEVLDRCPNATLVASFFLHGRQEVERPLPLTRMVWREAGAALDAGDRRLRLVLPPLFDGATTRGLFDQRTGVLWAVDSFASMVPGPVFHADDVPAPMFDETFKLLNSLGAPWHQWLDPAAFGRHVDDIAALGATVVASAHGPILTGDRITDAFERVRAMAGAPIVPPPGQPVLDELVAQLLAEEVAR